jgi:hypothetical protein
MAKKGCTATMNAMLQFIFMTCPKAVCCERLLMAPTMEVCHDQVLRACLYRAFGDHSRRWCGTRFPDALSRR